MSVQIATLSNKLVEIVGAQFVRQATRDDAIDGVQAELIIEPANAEELARVLALANAEKLKLATRGGGTKLSWGNIPRGVDLILSTRRLNRIIEHAWGDMTATVEAGCTVAEFQQTLAAHNQRLAVDPLWPERATIGGIIATNDGGSLRIAFGSLRDQLIGVTIALPDGTLAKSGGKVVKNVAGYDLPKLMIGSMGTLGVIAEATFRLYPIPTNIRTFSFTLANYSSMNEFLLAIQDSQHLVPSGLQAIVYSDSPTPRVAVRFESITEAAIRDQADQLKKLSEKFGADEESSPIADEWSGREKLWLETSSSVLCKISTLPSQLSRLCESLHRIAASSGLRWKLIAQAFAIGLLRVDGRDDETLASAITRLRGEFEHVGGSLVLLRSSLEFKKRVDAWGDAGDALPLMRRIKEQFDSDGTLNPGRFVGGI